MTSPEHSPFRVCVVCTGNICRSPMAEFVLREAFAEAGLADRVHVDSGGTTPWEVGNPADPRTLEALDRRGRTDPSYADHRARQFERDWFDEHDLVLAADLGHLRTLQRLAHTKQQQATIHLLRSFDPASVAADDLEMDDPWYGGDADFDRTFDEITAATPGIVDFVRGRLTAS